MPPSRTGIQIRSAAINFFREGRVPRVRPQIKCRLRFIPPRKPADRPAFIGAQKGRRRHQCSGRSATAISDTRNGQQHGKIAMRPGGGERVPPSPAGRVTDRAAAGEERVHSHEAMNASRRSGANDIARSYGLDTFRSGLANCTAGDRAQSQRAPGSGANARLYFRISCRAGSLVRQACSATDALPASARSDPRNVPIIEHQDIESAKKNHVYGSFTCCFWRHRSYDFHGRAEGRLEHVEGWGLGESARVLVVRSWIVIGALTGG